MSKKSLWLLLTLGTAGLVYYLLRKKVKHKQWEKQRAEVLRRPKKHSHGEFVL